MAENYFQHAEHYLRIINALNEAQSQQQSGSSHQQQNPSHGQSRHGNGQAEGQGRPNGRDRDQQSRDDRDRTGGQDNRPAAAADRPDDRIGADPRDRNVTASEFGADPRQGDVRDQPSRPPPEPPSSRHSPNGPDRPDAETSGRTGHGQETRARAQGDQGNQVQTPPSPATGGPGSGSADGPETGGETASVPQGSPDIQASPDNGTVTADTAPPRKRPGRPRKVKPADSAEPSEGGVTDQSELL
ncbi:MAG: DUF4167 domain-containing protein [Inquilinaceae bacterium]